MDAGWGITITLPADFLCIRAADRPVYPTELATRACVVPWRQPVWVIEATGRDVDFVGEIFVLKGQLGAAPRTETPRALRSRPKPCRLTAQEPELRSRHAEPRDEWSASASTADGLVAVCLINGRARCLVTDLPAITSALQHLNHLVLCFSSSIACLL
jgi:hypothetical protein